MKILIIGCRGNLGGQLMKVFEGQEPVGWDREEIDITDKDMVLKKVGKLGPELVINATGYNAVDKCEESEEEFELAKKINGYGPGYLAQICEKIGADLVHYSTDYVFSGDKKEGYKEDDQPKPLSNYGRSKYLGEKEVAEKTKRHFIVRTSKLFGPRGEVEGAKKSFLEIMLDAAKERKEIEVIDEEVSCFTYTYDLALVTRELLGGENLGKKHAWGIYHLVNEGPCTWYQCAKKLFEIAGKTVKVKPLPASKFPRAAKRPAFSVLLNTKGPKMRHWEEAVKDYLKISNL